MKPSESGAIMKKREFRRNDFIYKRVTKAHARKLVDGGNRVAVAPVNQRLDRMWTTPIKVSLELLDFNGQTLEQFLNEVMYYNCNSELGKYLAYYEVMQIER